MKVFGSAALTLERTEALSRTNLTIAKVAIDTDTEKLEYLKKYYKSKAFTADDEMFERGFLLECVEHPEKLIRLFKHGEMIKYPRNGSRVLTEKILLSWLQEMVPIPEVVSKKVRLLKSGKDPGENV